MHGRGECVAGRGHMWQGGVCAWQGACVAGGACAAGGVCVHGAWQGVCVAGGYAWQGACVAGGVHSRARTLPPPPGRYYELRSMSGRYASYWNALLFFNVLDNGLDAMPFGAQALLNILPVCCYM